MNHKRKHPRYQGRIPLNCKYWFKGMAKTNYRKQPKRIRTHSWLTNRT